MTQEYVDISPTWTSALTVLVPAFLSQPRGSLPHQQGLQVLAHAARICEAYKALIEEEKE